MTDLIFPWAPSEIAARRSQRRFLTAGFEPNARTLAAEHALLLRDVRRRTTPVLVLVETRTWPAAELRTLIGFLRSVVLRQVSDEERLLFPGDSTAAPFAELTMDHVRLHSLTEHLDEVTANPCTLPELTALIEELLATLERHLAAEEAVFGALPGMPDEVPGAAELTAGMSGWSPPQATRWILLDALPIRFAVQLSIERLLRVRPGETAEVRSSSASTLRRVWEWMRCYDSAGYGFSYRQAGPRQWQLQVTRRGAA